MVYEGGISLIDGNSTSTGVGLARGGLGVGVSRSKIKGTQQTALSKKATPPAKKKLVRNALFYFVGIFLVPSLVNSTLHINNQILQVLVGCSYLGIAIFHLYKNFIYNKTVWPPLYQAWDKTYMCQICGTFFKLAN
jgi:hypothetical protein